jgi:hypothetical protein
MIIKEDDVSPIYMMIGVLNLNIVCTITIMQNDITNVKLSYLMPLMLKATRMMIHYPFQREYLKIKNKGLRPLKSHYQNHGNNHQQQHKVEEKLNVHAESSVMNG